MRDAPHLLIVDDDDRLRDLLKTFLMRADFLVSTARDGAHARRLLGGLQFDLIVLDVMMPGEDGITLCATLRQSINTPILLLTAKNEAALGSPQNSKVALGRARTTEAKCPPRWTKAGNLDRSSSMCYPSCRLRETNTTRRTAARITPAMIHQTKVNEVCAVVSIRGSSTKTPRFAAFT